MAHSCTFVDKNWSDDVRIIDVTRNCSIFMDSTVSVSGCDVYLRTMLQFHDMVIICDHVAERDV